MLILALECSTAALWCELQQGGQRTRVATRKGKRGARGERSDGNKESQECGDYWFSAVFSVILWALTQAYMHRHKHSRANLECTVHIRWLHWCTHINAGTQGHPERCKRPWPTFTNMSTTVPDNQMQKVGKAHFWKHIWQLSGAKAFHCC